MFGEERCLRCDEVLSKTAALDETGGPGKVGSGSPSLEFDGESHYVKCARCEAKIIYERQPKQEGEPVRFKASHVADE